MHQTASLPISTADQVTTH